MGRSGTLIASWFMNEADLIITLGSSFAKHTGIERSKPIIQVVFERMQLGRFHPVTLPVWGEIASFCTAVSPRVRRAAVAADQVAELADRWAIWREERRRRLGEGRGLGVHSAAVFESLTRLYPADDIIAVDVGNNTYSFGRYFESQGQRVQMSGYLGSIGFGFPAAVGALAAAQDFDEFLDRKVVSISGDGGFGQYAMEFTTAVKYGMDITHILLNNAQFGKITKEQRAGDSRVWETDLCDPSFAMFVKQCGGLGLKVMAASDLDAAIAQALAFQGPSLVELMTDAELM